MESGAADDGVRAARVELEIVKIKLRGEEGLLEELIDHCNA